MSDANLSWLSDLSSALEKLGWESYDDVSVEIGGVSVSGIHQSKDANSKWSKSYGTVTYQNDAFIVIKNKSRNPYVPSQYNGDLKQHHA